MRVLVAYGSKMGGTAGLASMVGAEFQRLGHTADVLPAGKAADVMPYDVVVVGGALYAAHWVKEAHRFVDRHRAVLAAKPVWMFSSGPLDDSASRVGNDIAPTAQVARMMAKVGARGHATFGGRLTPETAKGWMATSMAKKTNGDWRDADHVRRWVESIVVSFVAA